MKRLLVYLYLFINFVIISSAYAEEIKISKLSEGKIVKGSIVITNKIKIPLPEGEWKVLENKTLRGGDGFNWMPLSNIILVKSTNQDESFFDEFVEFSLVKIRDKGDSNKPFKRMCGSNRGEFILHKSKSKGNMFACFASGVAKSSFLKTDAPLMFRFKEKTNLFQDRKMLFSLSSYSSRLQTGSKVNFLHGSSLENFANKNQLDEDNSDLIAKLWSLKSIQNHQNFQNNMNFKEAHKFNLNDDYQNLEKEYAKLLKKDPTIKTVKKDTKTEKKKLLTKKLLTKKKVSAEKISPPKDLLEYENYEVKKYNVKFYKDGDWVRIGKKHLSPFESSLNFEYWGQFKDNKLTRLVETIWMKASPAHASESQNFFEEYTFQRQEYKSCVHDHSYLAFELHKSNKANCFLVRSFNPKDEIYSPSTRITSRVNINHGPSIMRKYFDKNNIDLPNTMLRAEHIVYSMNFFYAYYEMKAVDLDGSFDKSKVLNKASVKKFIKQTAENHLDFQEELEIVDNIKFNLSKYIDVDIDGEIKIAEVKKKSQPAKENQEKIKEDKKITKVVSDKDKPKKIIKTSEINFYKMKEGDYVENASILISKNNKILLPVGVWQIAKKNKITAWKDTDNVILVNQSSSDSPFGDFIEISVTSSIEQKWYPNAIGELKKPCKKRYYFHELQKVSGSGNSFSCFASGFVENEILQATISAYNPWNFKFRNYLASKGTLTNDILFSLSGYAAGPYTNQKMITVVYGSSLNSISDENKIDIQNEELIKNIWTKKTISFHNNFQKSMNFKKSHIVNLDAEYQDLENKYADLISGNKTKKIVKKETKIKTEKKEIKVVKKTETKKEEFKPKKTNNDNDAPIIEIAETITVSDSDYEFKGKVTDQAKTVFIEVDGYPIDVSDGTFTVKGYSPVNKKITIEAIDQWGNRSEPKIVNIILDKSNLNVAEKLEPLNPSNIKTEISNNKVALIIGIEKYEQSPKASYANLDAQYFSDYANKGFGIKKKNIKMLIDENATLSNTYSAIFKWLPGKIVEGETDLILFFSGHGLASSDGKEKYILPSNVDPDLLSRTALSRKELFNLITKLKPKSVTMFFDTCYSGVSRDEETLLASAKPLRIVADDDVMIPNNFTIFTASKPEQISSGFKETKHGIFSYYLMKGLEGNADSNQDNKITNNEMLVYLDENVSNIALDLGRQQNPSLMGDPDKVLMSYR